MTHGSRGRSLSRSRPLAEGEDPSPDHRQSIMARTRKFRDNQSASTRHKAQMPPFCNLRAFPSREDLRNVHHCAGRLGASLPVPATEIMTGARAGRRPPPTMEHRRHEHVYSSPCDLFHPAHPAGPRSPAGAGAILHRCKIARFAPQLSIDFPGRRAGKVPPAISSPSSEVLPDPSAPSTTALTGRTEARLPAGRRHHHIFTRITSIFSSSLTHSS